ncbi:hypothetical protein T492DRAFT_1066299, partial [Pavlovales sp. CCMP2436]|mmetsp:Transcript_49846/g.114216  ORF Transcript_49846/g.114216 Transcript_49846/m.114216 type:complete len:227 (+) Transcript_49846:1-681(+)
MARLSGVLAAGLARIRPLTAVRAVWSEASAAQAEHDRVRTVLRTASTAFSVHEEGPSGSGGWIFRLRHADVPGVEFAQLRMTEARVLFGAASHENLPLVEALPLVQHAITERHADYALAALEGLHAWVASVGEEKLATEFGEEAAGALTAVALGRPRPGHSVLGQGTFRAAAPAWAVLQSRFAAETAEAEEARLYSAAGMQFVRIQPGTNGAADAALLSLPGLGEP